jgi:multiple sugar transport system permease protein
MEPKSSANRSGFGSRLTRLRRTLLWYSFILPPLLLILTFIGYPTLQTFRQSFFTRGMGNAETFAGLEHYGRLLTNQIFWGALGNTVLLGVAFLGIVIPLAAALASLLNRVKRGSAPLKVIYFLPQLTSSVAVALMFNYVFQPDWGLLNGGLRALGVTEVPLWLADPRLSFTGSRAAATLLAVWAGLGYFIIVILAGLQSIPRDIYDAAALDGANGLQTWWHITLPSLRPTFIFLIMTGTVDALARFGICGHWAARAERRPARCRAW